MCVAETDIWKTILTWAKSKEEILEQRKRDHDYQLSIFELKFRRATERNCHLVALENKLTSLELERETQALEMILHWVKRDGKGALKGADCALNKLGWKPSQQQHIEQLLKLMEQQYWDTQHPPSLHIDDPNWSMSVSSRKEIFKTMLEEIPKLIRRFMLRNPTLEARFSTTLDKILRLSSWTPSRTHNKYLRVLLKNTLVILNNLGDNEEYHDCLRDFMKRHTTFCAFTLDNAYAITAEDSETTAELCRNLRRLAQNLGKIASTKADQYQKLYENFIANKGDLSHWLDSASPGQGKLYFCF